MDQLVGHLPAKPRKPFEGDLPYFVSVMVVIDMVQSSVNTEKFRGLRSSYPPATR